MRGTKLHRPPGAARATALFAHCFSDPEAAAPAALADALADEGIAVLRFELTGSGESAAEPAGASFSSHVSDVVAAAESLRGEIEAPRILLGHSLGGAAVLAAAERIEEATAVATIGAPAAPLESAGQPSLRERLGRLGRALLVCHAPRDAAVAIDDARRIFEAARHPKSFVSLDDADHLLERPADAEYAARVVAAWAGRYLPEMPASRTREGAVQVRTGAEGFVTHVLAAGHPIRADEPAAVGGAGSGPSPYDLLLAALGACTSMTLRMYADRKKWPLEAIEVALRHAKIHARDCANCETEHGKIDDIERVVTLEGDLDEEQRARLLEIADKCPVHRTLHSEIQVRTREAKRSGDS